MLIFPSAKISAIIFKEKKIVSFTFSYFFEYLYAHKMFCRRKKYFGLSKCIIFLT